MSRQFKHDSPKLQIGEQWQHKESLETVTILLTSLPYCSDSPQDIQITFLTEYCIRDSMSYLEFCKAYKHIPHMKGAYH